MRSRYDPQDYCPCHFKTEAPVIRRINKGLVLPTSRNSGMLHKYLKQVSSQTPSPWSLEEELSALCNDPASRQLEIETH